MSAKRNDTWALVGKDGRTHDLSHGMIFVGREECDIVLQAASADKRHAVLCYNNNEQKFHIKDLNSLTGTYVNGIRIPEQTYVKLKRLDCIRFGYGPDVFYLEIQPPEEKRLSPQGSSDKNACGDTSEVQKDTSLHETNSCNLPSLTREDAPPDSLSLNLANNRQKDWDWIGDGALSDNSPDYSQKSETSSCSAPPNYGSSTAEDRDTGSAQSSPAATAFTIAFENTAVTTRKKLGIRDSISKFAPTKSDTETRVTFQKSPKVEPSPKKLPVTDVKSSIPKHSTRGHFSHPDLKELDGMSKIKDSASFLIKKMLNGEMSPSDIPEELPPKEKPLHPNDANDDHSEAGTYTVETEQTDCDVEEARKKIDEVFGVIQLSNSVLSSSYSSSTTSSSAKQIPRLNGRMKQSMLKNPLNPPKREANIHWNSVSKTYESSRPPLPSPAVSSDCLNRTQTISNSLQRRRKPPEAQATPDKTPRTRSVMLPKSPGKARTPSMLKSPGALCNNLSATPPNRQHSKAVNSEELTRRRSTDSRSEGSKSPHTGTQWQKVPWNLSGSDLDLDRSKSENNSILSDTSTEPSSHSSHSTKSRPDQGPQMRLNRAFALRRARLESESSKRGKDSKSSTPSLSGSQKSMKKSSRLSGSATALKEDSCGSNPKLNFHYNSDVARSIAGRSIVQCPRSDTMKRKIVSSHNPSEFPSRNQSKEISALDALVISAIHQLSSKLWKNSKVLLEKERKKCPKGSDTWLMIDEVLPQVPVSGTPEDGDFTKDLSSILKNLKRVEQGLDVLSSVLENNAPAQDDKRNEENQPPSQNFFIVDM